MSSRKYDGGPNRNRRNQAHDLPDIVNESHIGFYANDAGVLTYDRDNFDWVLRLNDGYSEKDVRSGRRESGSDSGQKYAGGGRDHSQIERLFSSLWAESNHSRRFRRSRGEEAWHNGIDSWVEDDRLYVQGPYSRDAWIEFEVPDSNMEELAELGWDSNAYTGRHGRGWHEEVEPVEDIEVDPTGLMPNER